MEHINGFKAAVAAVLGGLTALWGWFGWLVLAWLLCMALDYGTGTAAALRAGEWSSKVARDGLWHKLGAVVAVLVAAILDGVIGLILANIPALEMPFQYEVFVSVLVLVWYIMTELGSIVENIGALGAPVPAWLRKAIAALESGKIVVFGGGTGNPIFSTDTASALRALEIGADAMFKATMVDGVYDKDPHKYADAVRYDTLTFTRVLDERLAVMDSTAATLCRDNSLPILVFDLGKPANIAKALQGEVVGTLVKE